MGHYETGTSKAPKIFALWETKIRKEKEAIFKMKIRADHGEGAKELAWKSIGLGCKLSSTINET